MIRIGDRVWLDQIKEEIVEPDLKIIDPHHHLWRFPDSRVPSALDTDATIDGQSGILRSRLQLSEQDDAGYSHSGFDKRIAG